LNFKTFLLNILDESSIKIDEPMKKHTTFKLGGTSDFFVTPNNYLELQQIVDLCKNNNMKFYLLGNGSNTIVKDCGFNGVIIHTGNLNNVEMDGTKITAQCGALLPVLAQKALRSSLSGMEFISGIPGTVGGAVAMNAGAYGSEICSILQSVKVLTNNGSILDLRKEEITFCHRHTDLQDKNFIILEATFNLTAGDKTSIKLLMETLKQKRQASQPLEYPNAGSIFKKSGDFAAGYLIDNAGLKGINVGGAQISPKHANFIVNKDNASAYDVLTLIENIRKQVKEKYNITLDTEVIII
jgi:UDP-N-acetylmuramate dehydrogenase